jgi:hypothetical protein
MNQLGQVEHCCSEPLAMSKQPPRFTLEIGRWYAAEIIGDEFAKEGMRSYSPLRVDAVKPLGGAKRQFELHFYHLNYPEGVRDKVYTMQTLERGHYYLLVRSTDHNPARVFLIYEISWEWIEKHFRKLPNEQEPDIQRWLTGNA